MANNLVFDDAKYLEDFRKRDIPVSHIHWDGSVPAADLFRFYQNKGVILKLPRLDVAGEKIEYVSESDRVIDSAQDLEEFQMGLLTKYNIVDVFAVPVGAMQTPSALKTMARAHCRYLKEQGIPIAATRFAPIYHTKEGLSLNQVIGNALEGFREGREETSVIVKPIICINRETDSQTAVQIVQAALGFQDKLTGIDLACYEVDSPPERFKEAYELTFDSSLMRTVHAGEMCPTEEENIRNIATALTVLRADSISHAKPLYKCPSLIESFLERGVYLESNPISNLAVGFIDSIEELHLDKLVEAGVKVTINPDDPAMWRGRDLAHNLYAVGKLYGDEFVEKVIRNAWDFYDRFMAK